MQTELLRIIPVLPSSDIARDISWYKERTGFETIFSDKMYAILFREEFYLHLQWHADTADDPLLGGSVMRIAVKKIKPILEECIERGTIKLQDFRVNTPWGTNEFAFHDLNRNAIFISEDC